MTTYANLDFFRHEVAAGLRTPSVPADALHDAARRELIAQIAALAQLLMRGAAEDGQLPAERAA